MALFVLNAGKFFFKQRPVFFAHFIWYTKQDSIYTRYKYYVLNNSLFVTGDEVL